VARGGNEEELSNGVGCPDGGRRRVACVPGMGRGMGGSGRGEGKDAAGVEKEFRPRCARLREMVEDVKEVGISLSIPPRTPAALSLCMNMSLFPESPSNTQNPRLLEEWGIDELRLLLFSSS
jgi:hypothetical protein